MEISLEHLPSMFTDWISNDGLRSLHHNFSEADEHGWQENFTM
jgi:hypothetical protein